MENASTARARIDQLTAGYAPACVIGAAAELDLWTAVGSQSLSVEEISTRLSSDRRATAMLLDALAALELLEKRDNRYTVPEPLLPLLSADSAETMLPGIQHRMNVLRSWSSLAWTVRSGVPVSRPSSIRGPEADRAAFVAAMHSYSRPIADDLVQRLGPPKFTHLLDVGGASGTWTLAFLRAVPGAKATVFDLPDAVAQARQRMAASEYGNRVTLVPGDFLVDDLPAGADYAWVSAIVHMLDRQQIRMLFAKVFAALVPGGRIVVRDVVMQGDRTTPYEGAMFAINMLVNTAGGGTYTFDELAEDLQAAGFVEPVLRIEHPAMNSVVEAVKE